MSRLPLATRKELVTLVVLGDVKACVDLIEKGEIASLGELIAVCFADGAPSVEQFDVLVDGWHLVKEMERLRA